MDREEFTGRVEALLPGLYRIAVSVLRNRADAQDAVQQALLNAWTARERILSDNLRAYVTRIVVNECRNIQRAHMRVTVTERPPETAYEPPDGALREALDALSEPLRTPLLLKYMEGYSEQEVCRALRLPLTTVKSRLYRARMALKRELNCREVRFL